MAEILRKAIAFLKKYLFAAASCLYLFTFGFFRSHNRDLINTICRHFGYEFFPILVPKISLADTISENNPIQLWEFAGEEGNVSLLELVVIVRLTRRQQPQQVFEIGTFNGRTTLNIAANCGEQTTIYSLDLPWEEALNTALPLVKRDKLFIDKKQSGARFIGTPYEKKIVQLYGDSARFDFSPYFGKVDVIFIDGSHSYDYVLNDSWVALKLLRNSRGLIIWHDYNGCEGVTRALNELYTRTTEFKRVRHITGTTLAYVIFE